MRRALLLLGGKPVKNQKLMFRKTHLGRLTTLLTVFLLGGMCPAFGAGFKQLHGHVPEVTRHLTAIGRLPATNELHLAIGVPLRDPAGLD